MSDPYNLRGTRRTLDFKSGAAALDEGLISRAGWALFDDSAAVVLANSDDWVESRGPGQRQDLYFFAYGHDYKAALSEYSRFGLPIPLIPRFVLGGWWSRYWAYSDADLKALVGEFQQHQVPLDVLVVDMDWHTPHAWTGYSWNRQLFPDPEGFLKWAHGEGLRITLNLHPAQGVQHFEDVYEQFATAMGVPTGTQEAVAFRVADRQFVRYYFELLHHPLEDQGVDFWWLDWQQGTASDLEGLDPLLWLNHLHYQDSTRRSLRPLLYTRWGGLGNHRYPIGFSGDTYVTWEALRFQPYMTATASNVLYGWWSHDIGGHIGATPPELYTRWVQFGAVSPCLRLHSTKDPLAERRPWAYPPEAYKATKAAFHLRYQLVPYLYNLAREAADSAVSICRPMYYEYPESEDAYLARDQYMLGGSIIAAPIVNPADPATGLAGATVWVPAGDWIDYQTLETYSGPRWVRVVGDLQRLPMLVRAGAIIPLAEPDHNTDAQREDPLILLVYPGPGNELKLYEDDGTTRSYKDGNYAWTSIASTSGDNHYRIEIAPSEGDASALPARRAYEIRFTGIARPTGVRVDDAEHDDWSYDDATLTASVRVAARDRSQPLTVEIAAAAAIGPQRNERLIAADVERLQVAADKAEAVARRGGPLVLVTGYDLPEDATQHLAVALVDGLNGGNVSGAWTLADFAGNREEKIELSDVDARQALYSPWSLGDIAAPARWALDLRVESGDQQVRVSRSSELIFPAVAAWSVALYAPDAPQESLQWTTYRQDPASADNIHDPYTPYLFDNHTNPLLPGSSVAAYATTTINSPTERTALIEPHFMGAAEASLNGQPLTEITDGPLLEPIRPMQRPWHEPQTKLYRVTLRAGANELRLNMTPRPGQLSWGFGAIVYDEGGQVMTGVEFAPGKEQIDG